MLPSTTEVRQALRAELPYLRRRYDVERLGLCGSYVRGSQIRDSDVDLLVSFTETPTFYDVVELKHYLEDVLGRTVDLGMPGALDEGPAADNIRREVEYLDGRAPPPDDDEAAVAPPSDQPAPPAGSQRQYLLDMLNAMEDAEAFVEGVTFEELDEDLEKQYALQRAFEIIGEAAKPLSDDLRTRYPDVPWSEMAGMRDMLVHQYFAADLGTAWNAIHEQFPRDKEHLRRMLDDLPPDA